METTKYIKIGGDRVLIVINDDKFFILEKNSLKSISPKIAAKILLQLLEACHH